VTVTTGYLGVGTSSPIRTLHVNGGEISHTPSITTAFYNVSDSAGSNGGSYYLAIRGLGSSGTAQVNLAGFYVYAGVNVFTGVVRPNGSVNTPQTFTMPNSGGSSQWYKIGTAGMGQGGNAIKVTITSMAGYNAAIAQDAIVTIYFKTSNGSSLDGNGFAGDSIYWVDIANSTGNFNVKWKGNAAGGSATAYDLFVYMPSYTGASSFYTVEYDSTNVTWTNVMATGQAEPGVGSSTVCVATYTRSWYATYTGINRYDPVYALDVVGTIRATADIIAYSDSRVKTDLRVIENALDKVSNINGYTFTRTDQDDKDTRHAGVIAQEVLEVLPEVVYKDSTDRYSVAYGNLTALLIEALKEERQKREALEERLTRVEALLNSNYRTDLADSGRFGK
jgi:hypothetical protein